MTYLSIFLMMIFSFELNAQDGFIKENKILFNLTTLPSSDIHYGSKLMSSKKIKEKLPSIAGMDVMKILSRHDKVFIAKTIMIVPKPSTFFTSHKVVEKPYLKKVFNASKVEKLEENKFMIHQDGSKKQVSIFLDSDDMSSIVKSSHVKAVMKSKKLDTLSKGSSATVIENISAEDGSMVRISNYISIDSKKTMIIAYWIKTPNGKNKKSLIKELMNETLDWKNSYNKP
jgi:hypothetical protein